MGTHNVHRAAELLHDGAADGSGDGDPRRRRARRPRPVPVRPAGRPRDVVQRVGHDPDRLRQQLRVLHRPGRARRRDLAPVRRDRRRGRRAGRRRRHRGHAARPERQQLRARPAAGRPARRRRRRPGPPAVRRPAARRRRRGRHPPRALHVAAPQGHAPGDVRRDGGDAGRVPAPPLPAAGRLRPRPGGDAPRLHRRALPRPPGRGPPGRARPGGVDRHHRRLPGRDRRRLRSHARGRRRGPLRRRLHVHLLAPSRHRGGRRWPTASSTRPSPASRFDRLRVVVERSALGRQPGPDRAHRGGARRGAEQEGPGRARRPHAAAPPRPLPPPIAAAGRHVRHGRDHRRRAAPPHRASCVEVVAEPTHRTRIPVAAL